MGKSRRGSKEITREQKLIKENRQLKRELSHLRKQISRLDLEGLEAAKAAVFEQEEKDRFNENVGDASASSEQLKKIWKCNKCETGFLEINLYTKCGLTQYYRKCNNCDHRTQGKRYDETVRGIIKK